jgi:hypothetical protein
VKQVVLRGDGGLYLAVGRTMLAVDGTARRSIITTLCIDLNPALRIMSGTLTLPPGMFTWKSVNPSGPPIAPYDADLYPGTHLVQFILTRPIAYDTVRDLVLHLQGSGANQNAISLALWNYRTKDWTPLSNVSAGDTSIPDPAQHAGPGGEIRVKMEAVANAYPHLDRLDFTLTVH